jgi:hypothetical protein
MLAFALSGIIYPIAIRDSLWPWGVALADP